MLNNHYSCAKYSLIFCLLISACASGQHTKNLETPTASSRSEYQELKDVVSSSCLVISPEHPSGNQIPWILLLRQGIIPYAIDPNTGVRTEQLLPNSDQGSTSSYADGFTVSPDGKWLAYAMYSKNDTSLVIEPSNDILENNSQSRIIWKLDRPSRLEGWLSNENVMLVNYQSLDDFGSTQIYNAFSGEQHEFFLHDMPDYLSYQLGMSGSYLMDHGNLIPDPTGKKIVYPAWPNGNLQLALWDVETERTLASLPYTPSQLSRYPFWSQDGSDFLIVGLTKEESIEWHRITRDGSVHQLTRFGEFLKDAEFNLPSRSWDGRYLAFQLIYNTRKESKYLILDLKSQSLEGFCIDLGGEDSGSLHSPVWSPDNKYVAITNGVYSENITDVILVDVENREAFHIGHDDFAPVFATGWIAKP